MKTGSRSRKLLLFFTIIFIAFFSSISAQQINYPIGDLNGDFCVDINDMLLFVEQWLDPSGCSGLGCADFDGQNGVDFNDFALFAQNWLLTDETRVNDLLSQMTLAEKLAQLSGNGGLDGFQTPDLTRLGIPGFRMSDGPSGVRVDQARVFPARVFPARYP